MLLALTLVLTVLALLFCIVIVARHWKELRLMDPDSIKEERVRQKRDEIIEQRFERVKSMKLTPVKLALKRSIFSGKTTFHALYLKLIHLDRLYKQTRLPFERSSPTHKERIESLLEEARSLGRDLKWAEAERKYLDVLSLDDRSAQAYKGLGVLYLRQKLYPQARETFEFLVKRKQADDATYGGLGDIALADQDVERAEEMYRKALSLKPRLPHWHAVLAQFYLEQGQADKAWPLAKRASDLEPKSVKYLEVSLQAAILMKHGEDAQRRYDRLRFLVEDHSKLEAYREKLQGLRQ